jgi:hypothetical protein
MKTSNEENGSSAAAAAPWDSSTFQLRVLEKLGRLETKMDMIVGNGQPGRMKLAEDRLVALEKNDLRRTVYDRLTAAITFAISATIAWHDHIGLK